MSGPTTRDVVTELPHRLAAGDPQRGAELYAPAVDWRLSRPADAHGDPRTPWIRDRAARRARRPTGRPPRPRGGDDGPPRPRRLTPGAGCGRIGPAWRYGVSGRVAGTRLSGAFVRSGTVARLAGIRESEVDDARARRTP
ncbi:hypothetical protein GCM10010123_24530 [Pilimelia anulata]|uniref:Uncharacterized protein n=1 Tax=Pilimelia anulata TaxID=53371 RepID=A0A8J3B7J0_9ACTN|nr:hypothetical protein GCM10010123_24530 [Pilimelia anulata]